MKIRRRAQTVNNSNFTKINNDYEQGKTIEELAHRPSSQRRLYQRLAEDQPYPGVVEGLEELPDLLDVHA